MAVRITPEKMEEIASNIRDVEGDRVEMDAFQAKDDHGARRVPPNWRFSVWAGIVASAGVSTTLAFPLAGAFNTSLFGAPAMITAAALTAIICSIGAAGLIPRSIEEGVNIDMMSRSLFGMIGSAFTSLPYGIVGAMYFALEAIVMGHALMEYLPIPFWMAALAVHLIFLPLGIYGMVFMSKFQGATLVIYVIGIAMVVASLIGGWSQDVTLMKAAGWLTLNPNHVPYDWQSVLGAFSSYFGPFGVIMIISATDIARLIRRSEMRLAAFLYVAFNVVVPTFLGPMFGLLLFASTGGTEPNPGVTLVKLLGPAGMLLVLITQFRINQVNAYLGTLALANFFARIFHFVPGRHWMLIPFLAMSYLITLSPILEYFGVISKLISVFLTTWAAVCIGELVLVRSKRKEVPPWYEYRRAFLRDYNWIGFVSMWLSTIVGWTMVLGVMGTTGTVLSVPVAGLMAFFMPWVIVTIFLGKPEQLTNAYLARIVEVAPKDPEIRTCPVTGERQHRNDFVFCPFHNAWISSYGCLNERRCNTMCHQKVYQTEVGGI